MRLLSIVVAIVAAGGGAYVAGRNASDRRDPRVQEAADRHLETPIVIETGPNARYPLTSVEEGTSFDVDGDGTVDRVAWTAPDSDVAFLARDINGDGQINTGLELFGNHTVVGEPNGFEVLRHAAREANGGHDKEGLLNVENPLFATLLLWTDRNHNGVSESSELRAAGDILADIGLGYEPDTRQDAAGNRYRYRGFVHIRTAPGPNLPIPGLDDRARLRAIYDVYLVTAR